MSWINRIDNEDDVYDMPVLEPYLPFSRINFIVSQEPMLDTLQRYYQMLYENSVDIVIKVGNEYNLPQEEIDKVYFFGSITKKTTCTKRIHKYLLRSEVEFFNTTSKIKYGHNTIYFQFTD